MSILVVAEHDNTSIKAPTLVAIAAAQAIGGDIDLLVACIDRAFESVFSNDS